MIDIVERLRDNYTWLTRDGFDTSARNIADAANEIESLRQQLAKSEAEIESWKLLQTTMEKQLAEKDAEIERLKTVPMKYRRMEFNAQLQRENDDLRLQLAEVDALRSHQESVEATHRITLRDVQKESMRLQSENDALSQQLEERDAEIGRLKSESRDACIGLNHYFGEQLAASQAREQQLREALRSCYSEWDGNKQVQHFNIGMVYEALAMPTDTTAIEALVTKAGEVMRERAISAASAINPVYGSGAAIDAISTVLIVTLDDLKGSA